MPLYAQSSLVDNSTAIYTGGGRSRRAAVEVSVRTSTRRIAGGKGRWALGGLAIVLAVASSGCASTVSIGEAPSNGPRVLRHEVPVRSGEDALVEGELSYDETHDCFLLEMEAIAYPVVWPFGTEGRADGPGVVLADGTTVRVGHYVSGGGGFHDADAYLGDATLPPECVPPSGEVAVYNSTETLDVRDAV